MYTQHSAYERKISSTTVLLLLLLSALLVFLPVAAVQGSTGHPTAGTVTSQATLAGYTAAANYVNVTAGAAVAGLDCGATFPASCTGGVSGFLAFNTAGVTFSGSQFALYLSKDGLSQISPGDIAYAGGLTDNALFTTAELNAVPVTSVVEKNGTFYLGNTGILSGPIPVTASHEYKYLKIFDGSTTALAVSAQYLTIMPGLSVKPTAGSAGQSLTFTGGGFPTSTVVDILYTYTYNEWTTAGVTVGPKNESIGVSTGSGYFTVIAPAIDTQAAVNPTAGIQQSVAVTFTVALQAVPHTAFSTATATYTEWPRYISEVVSYDNTGTCVASTGTSCVAPFSSTAFYGNDSGTTGAATINGTAGTVANIGTLNTYVLGSLGITGKFFYAGAAVTVWIGTTQIGSATADNLGNFLVNASIPVLPQGSATVFVKSNGVSYRFTITVQPTLVLTPNNGPVGTTVTATAYGFTPNKYVSLWWNEHTLGDGNDYYLGNFTVNTAGSFNVTVTFTVPHTYGGSHPVDATYTSPFISSVTRATITGSGGFQTSGSFKVTATLIITPSSVDSNSKTLLSAQGTGFDPTKAYNIEMDNALFGPGFGNSSTGFVAASNGDAFVNFTSSGFRPGLHQLTLIDNTLWATGNVAPAATAYFNVTTNGDYIFAGFAGISASVTSAVNSQLTSISTAIANLQSSVSGISSTLTTLSGQVQSAASSASSAASAAQQAATAAQTAANNTSGIANTSTYVLVVAVLAAIVLVLELAILVRKLS